MIPRLVPEAEAEFDPFWVEGVRGFTRLVVPPAAPALDLAYVKEKVLRVINDGYDDPYIAGLIAAGTRAAEHATHRAIQVQTLAQVIAWFPAGPELELRRAPVTAIESIEYLAADGVRVVLNPAAYELIAGGVYQRSTVRRLGNAWPVTAPRRDAVTVTYRAGFTDTTDPELGLILRGVEAWIAERYDGRGLSVVGTSTAPGALGLRDFWRPLV